MSTKKYPEAEKAPQSPLERQLILDYLTEKETSLEKIRLMPEKQAKILMREACTYASLKLAEIESRSKFRNKIHYEIES